MINAFTRILATAVLTCFIAACETNNAFLQGDTSSKSGPDKRESFSPFTQFPNIPIPAGSKINAEKTLVFGSKPWYGQLALKSSSSANRLFDFYRENLPQHGWQEVTSIRAPTSILTYSSPERVLAIAIQSATLIGSNVTVTVSPRGVAPPQSPSGNMPTGVIPAPVQKLN